MPEDVVFTKDDVSRYRTSGECPHCRSILVDKSGFSRTVDKVERKVRCSYCGIVFYSTYKFDKLVFDGWMYGGEINGRGLPKTEGEDLRTQQSVRGNGHTDNKTNRSKRGTLGSGRRSAKKGGKKTKRNIPSKKDKGSR